MYRFVTTANSIIGRGQCRVLAALVLISVSGCSTLGVVNEAPESQGATQGTELAVSNVATPAPQSTSVKANVYETLVSNYVDVFEGLQDIDQSTLIFPNDSLRLGDANKQIIEDFVESMNSETDVLSVIGCSHGRTEINNGNSLLAIGRAHRVKEALMFSGVEHDKIFDEGCWAPQTFDEAMPRRGVVLTLKRKMDS